MAAYEAAERIARGIVESGLARPSLWDVLRKSPEVGIRGRWAAKLQLQWKLQRIVERELRRCLGLQDSRFDFDTLVKDLMSDRSRSELGLD